MSKLVNKRFLIDKSVHYKSLHDAYTETIFAVTSLVEAFDEARLRMIKHDLAAEPRLKTI